MHKDFFHILFKLYVCYEDIFLLLEKYNWVKNNRKSVTGLIVKLRDGII